MPREYLRSTILRAIPWTALFEKRECRRSTGCDSVAMRLAQGSPSRSNSAGADGRVNLTNRFTRFACAGYVNSKLAEVPVRGGNTTFS